MDDGKVVLRVEVDAELAERAKQSGLDVAQALEHALRSALRLEPRHHEGHAADRERVRREVGDEIAWYNRRVEEHGLFADDWRKF